MACIAESGSGRSACRLLTALALALIGACTSGGDGSAASSVPVVTPSSAYSPFRYTSPAQRAAFEAYVACAAAQGVDYQGPFVDSTGKGIFFRLAPGESASHPGQEEVSRNCPQGIVGLFGTPIGQVHVASFERAATEFARCVGSHGQASFPLPVFQGTGPVATFWRLPFDWSSDRFTDAVGACVDLLRSYLFSD